MLKPPFLPKFTLLLVFALALALLASACGTGGPNAVAITATPEPTPDPASILETAADTFQELRFFSFVMTHENGGTPIAFGLVMEDVAGQVAAPDRLKAEVGAWAGSFFFDVSLVAIDQDTYLTNPFTDEFEKIDGGIISSALLDPATGIGGIIRDARDPVLQGEVSLDGVATYHITSTIDSGQLTSISPSAQPGIPIDVGIWIGKDDSYVYKIWMDGQLSDDEEAEIIRIITLSDFGVPVEIEVPSLGSDS